MILNRPVVRDSLQFAGTAIQLLAFIIFLGSGALCWFFRDGICEGGESVGVDALVNFMESFSIPALVAVLIWSLGFLCIRLGHHSSLMKNSTIGRK